MRKLIGVSVGSFVASMVLAAGPPARAWHAQGHLMTAEVAWAHMTPAAQCRAALILRNKIYGLSTTGPGVPPANEKLFVTAATWPDRIKQQPQVYTNDGEDPSGPQAGQNIGSADKFMHKYWHYVDYPVPDNPSKPPPDINAAERIKAFRDVLATPPTASEAHSTHTHKRYDLKAYDLAWLIHLVGDVHQPLHTATQYGPAFVTHTNPAGEDAGGNGVGLHWSDPSRAPNPHRTPDNLHAYWDAAPGDDSDDLAEAVQRARALADAPTGPAGDTDIDRWISESHALADSAVYTGPITRGSKGKFDLSADDAGRAYLDNGAKLTQAQVALGGARLAALLNAALVWPAPGCPAP